MPIESNPLPTLPPEPNPQPVKDFRKAIKEQEGFGDGKGLIQDPVGGPPLLSPK